LLSLRDNNFSGTIPTELFQLTNLKSLSLGENSLNGSIPTEIGNLEDLGTLWNGME
jgi:Leucine-rich repeat (LRR) protein